MSCKVQTKTLDYLKKEKVLSEDREILDYYKYNILNDHLTKMAYDKFSIGNNKDKLFYKKEYSSTRLDGSSQYITRAEANTTLFNLLDEVINGNNDILETKVKYNLKAIDILASNKAEQVFAKGKKAGWDLERILDELEESLNDTSTLNTELRAKINKVQKELQNLFINKKGNSSEATLLKDKLATLKQELKDNEDRLKEQTEGIPKEQKQIILEFKTNAVNRIFNNLEKKC